MAKRWIIRGIFLVGVVVWAAVWGVSHWQWISVRHDGLHWSEFLDISNDSLIISASNNTLGIGHGDWNWSYGEIPAPVRGAFERDFAKTQYHALGFALSGRLDGAFVGAFNKGWVVVVPLWFPTLISGLMFWLVWRKTRAGVGRRAFPVQVVERGGEVVKRV